MGREETVSIMSLLNTAKMLEENPILFKLKEMEYLERVMEKVSTISIDAKANIIDQLKILVSK